MVSGRLGFLDEEEPFDSETQGGGSEGNFEGVLAVDRSEIKWAFEGVPGRHMGLDLSLHSSGIVVINDGEVEIAKNLDLSKTCMEWGEAHKYAGMRVKMREALLGLGVKNFNTIVVEDVWFGDNPDTVKSLLSINTVIDEMIITGEIQCERFIRVGPDEWRKRILDSIEGRDLVGKGRKEFAWGLLREHYGVTEEKLGGGKGVGDLMDASGLLISLVVLEPRKGRGKSEKIGSERKKIGFNEIEAVFCESYDEIDWETYEKLGSVALKEVNLPKVSEKTLVECLERDDEVVWVTGPVNLGYVGMKLGLVGKAGGGWLAFWRRKLRTGK